MALEASGRESLGTQGIEAMEVNVVSAMLQATFQATRSACGKGDFSLSGGVFRPVECHRAM
eukprot:6145050-Alexandrium_andersonii.AAC.1